MADINCKPPPCPDLTERIWLDISDGCKDYCDDKQLAIAKAKLLKRITEESLCLDPITKVDDVTIDRQGMLKCMLELFERLHALCPQKKRAFHAVSTPDYRCRVPTGCYSVRELLDSGCAQRPAANRKPPRKACPPNGCGC